MTDVLALLPPLHSFADQHAYLSQAGRSRAKGKRKLSHAYPVWPASARPSAPRPLTPGQQMQVKVPWPGRLLARLVWKFITATIRRSQADASAPA